MQSNNSKQSNIAIGRSGFIINKFDGHDFSMWKLKVTNELSSTGIDVFLTTAPNPNSRREKRKDLKALTYIKRCLSDKLLRNYCNITTTKELWDQLLNTYSQVDAQMMFMKKKKFYNAIKSSNETMSDFISRLKTLRDELVGASYEMSNEEFILTLMSGTHQEFGTFVSSITGKKNVADIDLSDLCNKLIREDDLRRMDELSSSKDQSQGKRVMYTSGNQNSFKRKNNFKVNNKKKFQTDKSNQQSNKETYKGQSKSKSKHNRKCYNCGVKGHYANECRRPKSLVTKAVNSNEGKTFVGNCQAENSTNLNISQRSYVLVDNLVLSTDTNQRDHNRWLLDSGASMVMYLKVMAKQKD
jgi:hypothetical protein